MDLTFLGTAAAYPTAHRGVSCTVFRNGGTCYMFDCGEGSQVQLQKSNIKPGKITKIFITHLHGDHLYGLPGLLCTVSANAAENCPPLEIYGPLGLRRYIRESLTLSRAILGLSYVVHELKPMAEQYPPKWTRWVSDYESHGDLHPNEKLGRTIEADENQHWQLCSDAGLTVTAGRLTHWVPTFGFVIDEAATPGKLDASRLKAMGIPPGPLYAKIKAGETVQTPDGQMVTAEDVTGPPRLGRKVVVLGDTADSSNMADLCRGADAIAHESTLGDDMEEKAKNMGHSSPGMAGRFALGVGAKMLILTHFSQRYRVTGSTDDLKEGEDDVAVLVAQGKVAFQSTNVVAAEDLLTVAIPSRH